MNATYNWKAAPETAWYALGTTIGGIVGAVLGALGVDAIACGLIAAAITPLPRAIIGIFLPAPPTTGAGADKSS